MPATPERNIYLNIQPLEDALTSLTEALAPAFSAPSAETVPSHEAAGRVLAAPVFAALSSPPFHAAAMDGVAVQARATFAARESMAVRLALGSQAHPVNTGNPLPDDTDAVVMIEQVRETVDGQAVEIEAPAFPWQHVRRMGEDIVATELIFPRGHELAPWDVGALLSAGVFEVSAVTRPRIRIVPTGDEVLDFTTRPTPKPGQVVESNSMMLAALVRGAGGEPERVPPVGDDVAALSQAVGEALKDGVHGVILCAGSSAGSKDFTRAALSAHGEVLVHGVAAMPGKPALLGVARTDAGPRLLAGAPGYPVSTLTAFEQLIGPLIARLAGKTLPPRPTADVVLSRRLPSKLGMEEFVRCALGEVADPRTGTLRMVASPLARGAGNITTACRAQGVIRVPRLSEGAEAGESLTAELVVPRERIARILLAIGSHDNILDLLADGLMAEGREAPLALGPVRLASTHAGSMGGLAALREGYCHLAGAHLFDPETGDYNFPFLATYLAGVEVTVVNLAIRHQGLMVAPGNPHGISCLADLATKGLSFVNRQRGAGTRILLDHHLAQEGVPSPELNGYGKEESTHMAVAVNVAMGAADAGLGILAAARALSLDFVPLARERYDLLIPTPLMADVKIETLLALIRDETFQERIRALGGYETTLTGQVMEPGLGLGE